MKIKLIIFFLCLINVFFADTKFILLLGPSGIGKSSLIKELQKIDDKFEYIKPFTTRPLRPNESDKVHVSLEEIQKMENDNKLAYINFIYGNYYATPIDPIYFSVKNNKFPILDWPVDKVQDLKNKLEGKIEIITFYIYPKSLSEWEKRLNLDDRDVNKQRFNKGKDELNKFYAGDFDDFVDYKISNEENSLIETADEIYKIYLRNIK